jgi:gluconate 2-dehydrogenase gamma chain
MENFFDKNYQTPNWLIQKLSRRKLMKSAAGMATIGAMTALPRIAFADEKEAFFYQEQFQQVLKSDPWKTLNAVLEHLLPSSENGPGAKELHITQYLYNVVFQQPTEQDEIDFIYKGVGWLNGYTNSQLQSAFVELSVTKKETMLRAISRSSAGENWINNLLGYVFEAMLSPPAYGGNPEGVGWQWLEHQAGFPLPKAGERYFELPPRSTVKNKQAQVNIPIKSLTASRVTPKNKRLNKA